jgi:hypothetical protein
MALKVLLLIVAGLTTFSTSTITLSFALTTTITDVLLR